jgi:AcrR family transcriptional regulator
VTIAKPSGKYHHGDLRQALLLAAKQVIEEQGSKSLTLRGVARLAGVSPAAPYRHFIDKNQLLTEVANQGFEELCDDLAVVQERGISDPARRMQALGVAYVLFATKNPAQFRFMFGSDVPVPDPSTSLAQAKQRAFGYLLDSMKECQRIGLVREGNARYFALCSWSMVHGVASLYVDGQLPTLVPEPHAPEEIAALVTATLWSGLFAAHKQSDRSHG